MSEIDKYNAPRGCFAVAPEEYSRDGIGECSGCCFDSEDDLRCMLDMQHDYVSTCWAEERADEQDVIFKREEPSPDDSVTEKDIRRVEKYHKMYLQIKEKLGE